MQDQDETKPTVPTFDFDAFPQDTLFYERRTEFERRLTPPEPTSVVVVKPGPRPPAERRAKKERRRRIDPTTFEKQYTEDELEFMNAMQRFKVQTGKSFPSHGDVLRVAFSLGYRKIETVSLPADDPDDVLVVVEPTPPVVIPTPLNAL